MNETRHESPVQNGPKRVVKAFIIHLKRASDRQPQVERLIDSLPLRAEVIDAVDGRVLDGETIQRVYRRSLHTPP